MLTVNEGLTSVFAGELTAHAEAPIYDVKYHNNLLFTASGDTTVKVWSIKWKTSGTILALL